ncbi:MAG: hypothetical protein WAQ28_17245 [Bacteroidia bacterium]|jgi:hypothetical protein
MKSLLSSLLFIASACFAQSKFNLIATIPVKPDFYTTDKQGNVYIVKANELNKYNKSGKLLYKYSNKNLGNIDFVDASNMLRLLLFYKNFSQVVFLDNTLTLSGEPVSLDKIGFQQTQLVCSSYNNGMWLYNQQNLELVRLDQTLSPTQQTGNLTLLLHQPLSPVNLLEYDNKVYLNNPETGILIFDVYGTYYKTIPLKNVQSFQPVGDLVYYLSNNEVKAYNIKTTEEIKFGLPVSEFKNFRVEMDVLVLQVADAVVIYTAE